MFIELFDIYNKRYLIQPTRIDYVVFTDVTTRMADEAFSFDGQTITGVYIGKTMIYLSPESSTKLQEYVGVT